MGPRLDLKACGIPSESFESAARERTPASPSDARGSSGPAALGLRFRSVTGSHGASTLGNESGKRVRGGRWQEFRSGPSWLGRSAASRSRGGSWRESASVVGQMPSRRRVCPSRGGRWLCARPLASPLLEAGRVPTPEVRRWVPRTALLLQQPGAASTPRRSAQSDSQRTASGAPSKSRRAGRALAARVAGLGHSHRRAHAFPGCHHPTSRVSARVRVSEFNLLRVDPPSAAASK